MGKKAVSRRYNSFRSLFSNKRYFYSIFRKTNGFTLVELLVVVSIIGILVVAALAILNPIAQIQKGNDSKRKEDLAQIQRALETHYHDLGRYPASDSSYQILYSGSPIAWGGSWSPYMSSVPKDPRSPSRNYVYYATSNGQSYFLYAYLERANDPQFCNNGNPCSSLTTNGIPTNACGAGGSCNFGVSSSNVSP